MPLRRRSRGPCLLANRGSSRRSLAIRKMLQRGGHQAGAQLFIAFSVEASQPFFDVVESPPRQAPPLSHIPMKYPTSVQPAEYPEVGPFSIRIFDEAAFGVVEVETKELLESQPGINPFQVLSVHIMGVERAEHFHVRMFHPTEDPFLGDWRRIHVIDPHFLEGQSVVAGSSIGLITAGATRRTVDNFGSLSSSPRISSLRSLPITVSTQRSPLP